jgi:hypothetical protein
MGSTSAVTDHNPQIRFNASGGGDSRVSFWDDGARKFYWFHDTSELFLSLRTDDNVGFKINYNGDLIFDAQLDGVTTVAAPTGRDSGAGMTAGQTITYDPKVAAGYFNIASGQASGSQFTIAGTVGLTAGDIYVLDAAGEVPIEVLSRTYNQFTARINDATTAVVTVFWILQRSNDYVTGAYS